MEIKIEYKDIAHAIKVLNRIKKLNNSYYDLGKVQTIKGSLIIPLNQKEHVYCPFGSTYYYVEMNAIHSMNLIKHMSATSYICESH